MIRESAAPGARHAFFLINGQTVSVLQYRDAANGASQAHARFGYDFYQQTWAWLRLVRSGATISSFTSLDGVNWMPHASVTLALPPDVLIGLAVTNHDNSALATGTFANVWVVAPEATPLPPPPIRLEALRVSTSRIDLSWQGGTPEQTGIRVERSVDAVNFAAVATIPGHPFVYSDSTLSTGAHYYYRIRTVHGPVVSEPGNMVEVATLGPAEPPLAPPGMLSAFATSSGNVLSWSDNSPDETAFWIERSSDGATYYLLTTVGPNIATRTDQGYAHTGPVWYRVRAVRNELGSDYSNVASTVAGSEPPTLGTWQDSDIGNVGAAGNSSVSGTEITVTGSGDDIWEAADGFHFRHQRLSGDGEIVARVTWIDDTHAWAKAGVMVRSSLTADAANLFVGVNPEFIGILQARSGTGATTQAQGTYWLWPPTWVKIVRRGNMFSGYFSVNGAEWTLAGSQMLNASDPLYIGLAVTSHSRGTLCTAIFDNVAR